MKEIRDIAIKINKTNKKYNETQLRLILYLYKNIVNTNKVVEYLNKKYGYELTELKLRDLAHRNNCPKKYVNMYKQSMVTRNDEYEMARLYKYGLNSSQIAKLYGYKTRNSVLQKLHKLNICMRDCNDEKIRNKSYNEFSFNTVDTLEKAYFLGLLLTDGYVNAERGYFGIDLTDEDAIKFISEFTKCKYSTIISKNKSELNKYRLILYGKQYIDQLKRLGVREKKTYIINKPLLNKEEIRFISYILRGIVDGDGWIRKDGNEFFICSASLEFMNWCKEILEYLGFKNIKVKYIKNNFNGIYIIRSAYKHNLDILKNKIYDKQFGMNRKYIRLHGKDVQRL